jgi:uncharacterized iron-regulated protein
MSNMSYCRFENTVKDMRDCMNALAEAAESGKSFDQFMNSLSSPYERTAVRHMAQLLLDMAEAIEQLHDNEGLSAEELEDLENA